MTNKEKTMVEIWRDDKKELMLFKIQSNAKNMPETIRLLIEKLKKEEKENECK